MDWLKLDDELLWYAMDFLPRKWMGLMARVCSRWRRAVRAYTEGRTTTSLSVSAGTFSLSLFEWSVTQGLWVFLGAHAKHLRWAAVCGHLDALGSDLIRISKGSKWGCIGAAWMGNAEAMRRMAEQGASREIATCCVAAAQRGHVHILDEILGELSRPYCSLRPRKGFGLRGSLSTSYVFERTLVAHAINESRLNVVEYLVDRNVHSFDDQIWEDMACRAHRWERWEILRFLMKRRPLLGKAGGFLYAVGRSGNWDVFSELVDCSGDSLRPRRAVHGALFARRREFLDKVFLDARPYEKHLDEAPEHAVLNYDYELMAWCNRRGLRMSSGFLVEATRRGDRGEKILCSLGRMFHRKNGSFPFDDTAWTQKLEALYKKTCSW